MHRAHSEVPLVLKQNKIECVYVKTMPPQNIKKLPSKVANDRNSYGSFQCCQPAHNEPKLQILFQRATLSKIVRKVLIFLGK